MAASAIGQENLMSKAEPARPEVNIRKARAADLEEYAKNVQSVADEERFIFIEQVTEERKESMRKLFKDRGALSSWRRSSRAASGN